MDIKEKRKRIEFQVVQTMNLIDPTGINAKKYQAMFASMNDVQFSNWITKFLADDKSNFRVDIEEFGDGKRVMKYENIEKAAKFLKIPLFEYVYLPHLSSNPNKPIRTKQPVLVGYLNIKRVQQLVSKKTGLALDDRKRDENTGQLRGDSKAGTMTAIENELLAGMGANDILSEICGARADNVTEYDNMLQEIASTGSVSLKNVKTNQFDKPSLLQADLYFKLMGLKTDIVSESYYSVEKVKRIIDKT
jgi:hypothetical protein